MRRVRASDLLGNTQEFGGHNVDSFAQFIDFGFVRSGICVGCEERYDGRTRKERQTAIAMGPADLLSLCEFARG